MVNNGNGSSPERYYGSNGKTYHLRKKLGSGGEGSVYAVGEQSAFVAKIFKERKKSRDEKVEALVHLPWPDSVRKYLVLPQVALYDDSNCSVLRGYIMERVDCSSTLADVYSETHPLSIYKKSCVAENLCEAVIAVHSTGNIVIGDFNSKNILVDRTNGKIRIIDTDSLHMKVRRGYRPVDLPCLALDPILFMPEILDKFQKQGAGSLEEITGGTFTKYTDYYCLAYHIHMLLMAQKPFGAAMSKEDIEKSVPAPTQKSMACRGQYAYVNLPARATLPKIYPNFNILTPKLQSLFVRAFRDGASDPSSRPSAEEFLYALREYTSGLQFCLCSGFDHYLYKDYNAPYCEWCRVEHEKKQVRTLLKEDIVWMTDDELEHYAELAVPNGEYAYLELAQRFNSGQKPGVRHAIGDKRKAKAYIKKCLKLAKKNGNNDITYDAKLIV